MSDPTAPAPSTTASFAEAAATTWHETADGAMWSRGRATDALLDLYGATTDAAVRAEIGRVIERWRGRSLVAPGELRAALDVICAAAAVESAFDRLVVRTVADRAAA